MFSTEANRDERSGTVTRRVFLAGSAVVVAGAIVLRMRQSPGVEASTEVHGTPGEVTIVAFDKDGTSLGAQQVAKIVKTDGAWRQQLGGNSFGIARQADTEVPYTGVSWREHARGLYRCVCCETALFRSTTKFESGTGWPSFYAPIAKENVAELRDTSLGVDRTEIHCARCEGHLGHVFNDGPEPTGLRYCMNSASMHFVRA